MALRILISCIVACLIHLLFSSYLFNTYFCKFIAVPPNPSRHSVNAVPLARRGAIQVSWSAPTVPNGELPITGYSIRYKVQNRNSFKYKSVTANSVEAMIPGLVPGTAYQVYVAGVNAIGTGLYCCEETPVVVRIYNGKLSNSCMT